MTGRLLLLWAGLLAAVTTAAVIVAPAVLAGLSVQVVHAMSERYTRELPVLPGAA